MRKSDFFLLFLAFHILLFNFMFIHASMRQEAEMEFVREKMEITKRLELTDLCLFTEANYTRHLSQADLHTPFQDSPMSLEHFPSGSLVEPSRSLRKTNEKVD
jgi:hypothetical protein